jgi:hypothetical protein
MYGRFWVITEAFVPLQSFCGPQRSFFGPFVVLVLNRWWLEGYRR